MNSYEILLSLGSLLLLGACSSANTSESSSETGAANKNETAREIEARHLSKHDDWVERNGPWDELETTVYDTCLDLVDNSIMLFESNILLTSAQNIEKELKKRTGLCARITVNRAHPQPEFENPKFVDLICGDDATALNKRLCTRYDLGAR